MPNSIDEQRNHNHCPGNVLFVDDESNILKSLKRVFYRTNINSFFANSGTEGLNILENNPIDMVVSDVKMPNMDGIQFLSAVKKRHPLVGRAFLSGYVEKFIVLKALTQGLATSYFAKPWDENFLCQDVLRLLALKKKVTNPQVLTIINNLDNIPSLPPWYVEFMTAVDEQAGFKRLAEIINQDTVVVAKILHISNSAFYGGGRTSSVEQALLILGVDVVRDVMLTVSLCNKKNISSGLSWHLNDIIRHSLITNKFLQKAHKAVFKKNLNSNYSSIGITHDIGKIIQLYYLPEQFIKTVALQKQYPKKSFFECESILRYNETSHTILGASLLNLWNLPDISIESALLHHDSIFDSKERDLIDLFIFVNNLANSVKCESPEIAAILSNSPRTPLKEEQAKMILDEMCEEMK